MLGILIPSHSAMLIASAHGGSPAEERYPQRSSGRRLYVLAHRAIQKLFCLPAAAIYFKGSV